MTGFFAWEETFKKTWESDQSVQEKITQTKIKDNRCIKRGIIRHFHVIVDHSEKIDSDGYLPNYRTIIIDALNEFTKKFFIENPISILSFLTIHNSKPDKYIVAQCDFNHSDMLNKLGAGKFSIENALEESISKLKKSNYLKEILIITQSLCILGCNDLGKIMAECNKNNVKVHCLNLCAEMRIFKKITEITGGVHVVPVDKDHFTGVLQEFAIPNPLTTNQRVFLSKFGFPSFVEEKSICSCHLVMTDSGYICPVCHTKVCNLPSECFFCKTQLVSFVNISKSLYHQYPLFDFEPGVGSCGICNEKSKMKCGKCGTLFCEDCNNFMHDVLFFCTFCA